MDTTLLFAEKGIKKTPARKAILYILRQVKKPVDVNGIIERLRTMRIKVDRVTVFRNINLLVNKRLIVKTEFNEGKYRYELSSLPHHHHFVCTKCGSINDIESDSLHKEIDKIARTVNKIHNFKIEEHKVEFFGKCKICMSK